MRCQLGKGEGEAACACAGVCQGPWRAGGWVLSSSEEWALPGLTTVTSLPISLPQQPPRPPTQHL